MAAKNRAILKNYFLKGNVPKENHFQDFIDSCVNQEDDGIWKKQDEALRIKAEGTDEEILQFYKNVEDMRPTWKMSMRAEDGNEGFNISEEESRLFIETGGNVGIGTTQPRTKLDVDGYIGMKGRIGFYAHGEIPADGEWHDVITGLNHYNAFEIIAVTGKRGSHAITHAIAVSAYGNSNPAVSKTQGFYGWMRNKIDIRWAGTYFDYNLQIRTKRNIGDGVFISYNIAKLF
jgi:hypothetical protein